MANLKEIKIRIGAVKKTKQITSAMKLVAVARLKRATDRAMAARPYRVQLGSVLARVAAVAGEDVNEPLLQTRSEVKSILVVVLTSDRGLCGPFNNGLVRKTTEWLNARSPNAQITMKAYGRKGSTGLKRVKAIERQTPTFDWSKLDKLQLIQELSTEMVTGFVDGQFDEVYVIYNRFVNTLVQIPTFERVLPLSIDESAEEAVNVDYRYEPSGPEILGALLPLYLRTLLLQAFLETEAGEHAARMTAMDNATKNASDLINRLTLDYNRARQAAITTEIIEIVAGAEAL